MMHPVELYRTEETFDTPAIVAALRGMSEETGVYLTGALIIGQGEAPPARGDVLRVLFVYAERETGVIGMVMDNVSIAYLRELEAEGSARLT